MVNPAFIQHDPDYDRVQRNQIGSVEKPVASFEQHLQQGHFSPVGRWKEKFPKHQLAWFETLVGNYLQELGYSLSGLAAPLNAQLAVRRMRLAYCFYRESKQWVENYTRLSRSFASYPEILIDK